MNIEDRIDRTIEVLEDRGLASSHSLKGCTNKQIEEIESDAGFVLPQAYLVFLLRMGVYAGRFFSGTDILYPEMIGMTEIGESIAATSRRELGSNVSLPSDAYVFAMHQGYQFFYFTPGADDPAVYYFLEGENETCRWAETFTNFLNCMARAEW